MWFYKMDKCFLEVVIKAFCCVLSPLDMHNMDQYIISLGDSLVGAASYLKWMVFSSESSTGSFMQL